MNVTALSSRPEKSDALQDWVSAQVGPRISNARRLAEESNQRKASSLAERVLHSLEMSVKTSAGVLESAPADSELRSVESELREAAGLIERTNDQCFRITASLRDSIEEAVTVLADNAVSVWQNDSGERAHPNSEWVQRAVNAIAQKTSDELAHLIQSLARRLSDALNFAAQATATGQRSEQFSLENSVKDLPAPDFGACFVTLHRPRSLALSLGLARRSVKNQIWAGCRSVITLFFHSYARTLEFWFRNIVTSIEREFNGAAEVYRAQLQRITAATGALQPDRSAAFEDILALKQRLRIPEVANQAESHVPV